MARLKRFLQKGRVEAGCDEAGRGCLAGPVFAGAVVLEKGVRLPGLNDSKKLSESDREDLRVHIEAKALAWAVGVVYQHEIDKINILNASFLAMHRAIAALDVRPAHLLIDGNRFSPYPGIDHSCIIKGDGKYASIAAASILAKTHRDEYMYKIAGDFPEYGWTRNKGYPTQDHRQALIKYGPCAHHRRSFKLTPEKQLSIFPEGNRPT